MNVLEMSSRYMGPIINYVEVGKWRVQNILRHFGSNVFIGMCQSLNQFHVSTEEHVKVVYVHVFRLE